MYENSILRSIKKLLGIDESYAHFDQDLIIHINSVLSILTQLGVGDPNGFFIKDEDATWNDFMKDETKLVPIISYVHMKVRLLFDPPMSSSTMEAMKSMISELEWRINAMVDRVETNDEGGILNG